MKAGDRIGPYLIVAPLGAGGMGEVYRARDSKLAREVALKILPDSFARDPDRRARFEREAKTLAALNHPHIAQIYGFEENPSAEGSPLALAMELVEGEDLSARIGQRPLPIDEAVSVARQLAEALEAAHHAGIVHRDLKPSNIKLRSDGTVKVLDFGLAKALDGVTSGGAAGHAALIDSPTNTSPAMTLQGTILGTAAYMAPEQAKGRVVDKRADIWAFGCVLYEMLTGQRAFNGEDVSETLAAILRAEPNWTKLPSIPPALSVLLKRCLERDVRRRIGDMSTVRFVLDEPAGLAGAAAPAIPDVEATQQRIDSAVARARRQLFARRIVPLLGLLALTAALAAFAFSRLLMPRPPTGVTRFQLPVSGGQTLILGRRMMALSDDGQTLVFVVDNKLMLRRLSQFESTPIAVTDTGLGVSSPVFSPDGAWLAFHAQSDGAVKRVSVSGGAAVRVCDAPIPLTMSWDAGGLLMGMGALGVLRCDGSAAAPRQIVKPAEGEAIMAPQVLPGGDDLLFTVGKRSDVQTSRWDPAQIVVQNVKTGARRVIVSAGTDGQYLPTRHLLYRVNGVLFAAAFDPATHEVRGDPVSVIDGVMRGTSGPTQIAVSRAGTLAYVPGPSNAAGSERELIIADRTGAIVRVPAGVGRFIHVRVSRDGARAAIGSDDGTDAIVWVYPLNGASAMQRLTQEGKNRFPIWSPDGQWIAYQSERASGPGLYRQHADGTGTVERLTISGDGETHIPESWSPDGRHLSYAVRGNDGPARYALWTLSLPDQASEPFRGVTSPDPIGSTFSPDGRWLAYTISQGDNLTAANRGVYVQPFPATGAVFQAPRQVVDFHPMWSADGHELIYVASTSARRMVAVSVKGTSSLTFGTPTRFVATVTGGLLSREPRGFDMLPDGRFIGVASLDNVTADLAMEIRVITNWFEELTERVPVK